tara:strand:+ start:50 stop:151 length:102 start_codon:yes stop_codon:yes gene_type:complete
MDYKYPVDLEKKTSKKTQKIYEKIKNKRFVNVY